MLLFSLFSLSHKKKKSKKKFIFGHDLKIIHYSIAIPNCASFTLDTLNKNQNQPNKNCEKKMNKCERYDSRVQAVTTTGLKVLRKMRAVKKLAGHRVSADGSLRYVLFVFVYL